MFTLSLRVSRRGGGRRPPPLLTATVAMALPGLLIVACSSHAAPAAAGAGAGRAAAAPVRLAGHQRSSARAILLLTEAARAARLMTYQGEEVTTRWSGGTSSELVSDIWHVSGGKTVTQNLATGTSFSSQPYLSADSDGQEPEGVLGVTAPLVQLIERHYVVVYAGTGTADGRAAQVVEAWRRDGSLAARFWLDDATKLPLEREVYDASSHAISQEAFIDVQFAGQVSGPAAADAPAEMKGPWADLMSRGQLLALRPDGWVIPAGLPGGLTLFTGAQDETSTGPVIDLCYSDGLNVISVFEQHGGLAARLAGWQKAAVGGHLVYLTEPDQHSLTWASRGLVFTVVADAPGPTVDAAVGALPHDGPPGFWRRISRGLARLAAWADPFR